MITKLRIALAVLGIGCSLPAQSLLTDKASVQPNTPPDQSRSYDRLGEMVTIPEGRFLMGSNYEDGAGGPEESPQHWVDLPAYRIGKYEVTRGQYRRFIEAGGYDDPNYWSQEGWKWKGGDYIIYAGMHGKFRKVIRPDKDRKRNQEMQSTDGLNENAPGDLLLKEIQLIRPNILWPQKTWGFSKVPRKHPGIPDVAVDSVWGIVADLHVFGHPFS